MQIWVARIDAASKQAEETELTLEEGATVGDALRAVGIKDTVECAVWNAPCNVSHVLSDGDRIDVLRPLLIDPKKAREVRAEARRREANRTWGRHGGRHQLHFVS